MSLIALVLAVLEVTRLAAEHASGNEAAGDDCWELARGRDQLLRDLCCHPLQRACFDPAFPPRRCCPNFHATASVSTLGGGGGGLGSSVALGVCSRGCAEAFQETSPWLAPEEMHWSMYPILLKGKPEAYVRNIAAAEALLDRARELVPQLLGTYSTTAPQTCWAANIWSLHYLVKHGRIAGSSQARVSLAAVTLLSWLATCERVDTGFVEDLWRFVRLTPPMVRYTVWLFAPTEAWPLPAGMPAGATAGSVVDIGSATGLDAIFYAFVARSQGQHGQPAVIAVEASLKSVRRLRRRARGLNISVLHRALVPERESVAGLHEAAWPWLVDSAVPGAPSRVRTATCRDVVEAAPRPAHYVKIDIEEYGWPCLQSLCRPPASDAVPRYISVEDPVRWHPDADLVEALAACGYTHFKLVRQEPYSRVVPAEQGECPPKACLAGKWGMYHSDSGSGPFGGDATDWRAGLRWRSAADVRDDLLELHRAGETPGMDPVHVSLRREGDLFDVHAARFDAIK